jgi:hypothetical protein
MRFLIASPDGRQVFQTSHSLKAWGSHLNSHYSRDRIQTGSPTRWMKPFSGCRGGGRAEPKRAVLPWVSRPANQSREDYVRYFENSDISEETAKRRGLLARDKGRQGFFIGRFGSPDLLSAFHGRKVSADKAAAIAEVGQGDVARQALCFKGTGCRRPCSTYRTRRGRKPNCCHQDKIGLGQSLSALRGFSRATMLCLPQSTVA